MENKKKARNSNIELVRIFSMFFIVSGHFISQSGNIEYSFCVNDYLLVFIGSASRIAVNVFLIISVWYMVDLKFSVERIMKLYIQLVTYSVPITALMLILNRENVSIKDFARGFLPFWGRGLWFVSAYITLMLFKPLLDKILSWSKKELSLLVTLLFVFISFVSTLPDNQSGYVIDSVWFLVVYILVGYIKNYPVKIILPNWNNVFRIVCVGGAYICLTVCIFLGQCFPQKNMLISAAYKLANQYSSDIKTIPNFLIALLLVIWVINLKPHYNKFINKAAESVFTVYIVHQVPAFISFIWKRIFMSEMWIPQHVFWYTFIVFALLYVVCSIANVISKKIIETQIMKCNLWNYLIRKIEEMYM